MELHLSESEWADAQLAARELVSALVIGAGEAKRDVPTRLDISAVTGAVLGETVFDPARSAALVWALLHMNGMTIRRAVIELNASGVPDVTPEAFLAVLLSDLDECDDIDN